MKRKKKFSPPFPSSSSSFFFLFPNKEKKINFSPSLSFLLSFSLSFFLQSPSPSPAGAFSPSVAAIAFIRTFIPSTLLAWASLAASSTSSDSLSAPCDAASSVMSTEHGSCAPLMTKRTVSSEEYPSNSALIFFFFFRGARGLRG